MRCFPRKHSPQGDPGGGVVYLRIVLSPEEASCLQVFLNMNVLEGGVVSTSPNPQAGGPPLVGCPRLLIQFIRSYPPKRRPFLYPQPEDAPCRGDRDPLHGLMAYCKANLKSNCNKASPCFRPFFIENMSIKCLPTQTLV